MLRRTSLTLAWSSLFLPLFGCPGRSASVADAGPPGPSIAFVSLPGTFGCGDDVAPGTEGLQLDLTVELRDDDGTGFAEVEVYNSANSDIAVAGLVDGRALLRIDLLAGSAPAIDNTLSASTTNEDGRALEISAVVSVDCEIPPPSITCTFESPLDGAVITADNVDASVVCVPSGLGGDLLEMLAGSRLRLDAVATSDGSTRSRELDLEDWSATGNLLLPGTGAHTLTATFIDANALFDPDPSVTIDIDVQP